MSRLLERLRSNSPIHDVSRVDDGYMLIGKAGEGEAFSAFVREAAAASGEDFVVFATSDGEAGYAQMFVMPLDET